MVYTVGLDNNSVKVIAGISPSFDTIRSINNVPPKLNVQVIFSLINQSRGHQLKVTSNCTTHLNHLQSNCYS